MGDGSNRKFLSKSRKGGWRMSVSLPLAMTSPWSKCLKCSAGWCQGRDSLADMLKRTRGRNWTTS